MISRIKRILESHLCNLYILHIENGTTVLFSPNRPNPSSRWWYKGMAKYHQNDECFVRICPLMNDAPRSVVVLKKGPSLDYLQWKNSSSLIYRARKHIYDSVDLSKCSLDDHFPWSTTTRGEKRNQFFDTHFALNFITFCTICVANVASAKVVKINSKLFMLSLILLTASNANDRKCAPLSHTVKAGG